MNVRMPDGVLIRGVPEGTTKAALAAKYSRYKGPSLKSTPEGVGAAIKRVPAAIKEEFLEATEEPVRPLPEESALGRAANTLIESTARGAGVLLSPFLGASKALVREPVTKVAHDVGLPYETAKGLGAAAEFGVGLVSPAGLAKGAVKALRPSPEVAGKAAGAQAVTLDPMDEVLGMASEKASGLGETGMGVFRQASRIQAKSVSYLDEPAKYSPTLASLREQIEHSDLPGKGTSQPDFNERTLLARGKFNTRLNEALGKVTRPELLRHELLSKSYIPPRGISAAPAGEIRALLDDVRAYANEAGLDLGYVRGYLPRVYDTKALSKKGDAFVQKLSEYGIPQEDGDLILRNITDGDGIVTNFNAGRSTVSSVPAEATRRLGDIPDEELTPFLRTDLKEVLPRYVDGVVRRAEYARTFGPNNETLGALIPKIKQEAAQSGRPLKPDEEGRIHELAEVLAGTYRRIDPPALRSANEWAVTYLIFENPAPGSHGEHN